MKKDDKRSGWNATVESVMGARFDAWFEKKTKYPDLSDGDCGKGLGGCSDWFSLFFFCYSVYM